MKKSSARRYSSGLLCPRQLGSRVSIELDPKHPEPGGVLLIDRNHIMYNEFGDAVGSTKMGVIGVPVLFELLKKEGTKRLYAISQKGVVQKDLRLVIIGPPYRIRLLQLDDEQQIAGIIDLSRSVALARTHVDTAKVASIDTVPIGD